MNSMKYYSVYINSNGDFYNEFDVNWALHTYTYGDSIEFIRTLSLYLVIISVTNILGCNKELFYGRLWRAFCLKCRESEKLGNL